MAGTTNDQQQHTAAALATAHTLETQQASPRTTLSSFMPTEHRRPAPTGPLRDVGQNNFREGALALKGLVRVKLICEADVISAKATVT